MHVSLRLREHFSSHVAVPQRFRWFPVHTSLFPNMHQGAVTSRARMKAGILAPELVSTSTPRRTPGRPTTACTPTSPRRCVGVTGKTDFSISHSAHYFSWWFLSAPQINQRQLPYRPRQDVHQRSLHGRPRGAHLCPEEPWEIQGIVYMDLCTTRLLTSLLSTVFQRNLYLQ